LSNLHKKEIKKRSKVKSITGINYELKITNYGFKNLTDYGLTGTGRV